MGIAVGAVCAKSVRPRGRLVPKIKNQWSAFLGIMPRKREPIISVYSCSSGLVSAFELRDRVVVLVRS
jgi:hypothetical protein